MKTELEEAIWMANRALDVPNADPDDDLRTISRQLLRTVDENASRCEALKQLLSLIDANEIWFNKNGWDVVDKAKELTK